MCVSGNEIENIIIIIFIIRKSSKFQGISFPFLKEKDLPTKIRYSNWRALEDMSWWLTEKVLRGALKHMICFFSEMHIKITLGCCFHPFVWQRSKSETIHSVGMAGGGNSNLHIAGGIWGNVNKLQESQFGDPGILAFWKSVLRHLTFRKDLYQYLFLLTESNPKRIFFF